MDSKSNDSRTYEMVAPPQTQSDVSRFTAEMDRHADRLREDGFIVLAELALLERDFEIGRLDPSRHDPVAE